MASSSLNCLSNSYSCRASTDMLSGSVLRREQDGTGLDWTLYFRLFPRNPPLASLVLLSGPRRCARAARQSRHLPPLPADGASLRPLPQEGQPRVLAPAEFSSPSFSSDGLSFPSCCSNWSSFSTGPKNPSAFTPGSADSAVDPGFYLLDLNIRTC